ncbi:MAG: DegT/DnrJ/EryC1/StrS family aminotransferase [FCB group bacterium]|jgi:8-amino-3,8-dideoxy-alpha-D-manno-octulosonate transaminase|nr:DegT/DnrJ/EryC1/StrS family aminotransferase [FCB group bacterium]
MPEHEQKLGLQGALKATTRIGGSGEPKIGPEEFMSVAERFGFSESALARIREIVEGEDWGEGPFLANYYANVPETKVRAFERVAREVFGTRYAMGVSSGSAALHAAFVAVGVGPGTEVICPAVGFIATAAAVVMAGGVPVFCDVDESLHMDARKLAGLINGRTVAVAPTHVMGGVADMEPILAVAAEHSLAVVEDCAQSCGATYRGKHVGTLGDVGCFSISAYKIVGGGEGGLILTDGELIHERASQMCEAGGLWRPDRFAPPRYAGELFCGTNYRMSELEAAVDVVQLGKAREVVQRFNRVKRRVLSKLRPYREITPQKINDLDGEVGYTLRFYPESVELGRRIVDGLQAEGIASGMRGRNAAPDWHIYHDMYPVVLKGSATPDACASYCPHYRERGGNIEYHQGDCPVADDLFERVITIQLNQWYAEADCDALADAINRVLSDCCKPDDSATPWIPA